MTVSIMAHPVRLAIRQVGQDYWLDCYEREDGRASDGHWASTQVDLSNLSSTHRDAIIRTIDLITDVAEAVSASVEVST